MFGAGMISVYDIGHAVEETHRVVEELGFKAIFLRANVVNGKPWHDPYYEPLWDALEKLDVPLGFHEATGSRSRQTGDHFEPNFGLRRIFAQPVEQMLGMGSFIGGGVLARHPQAAVAFLEANCSWVPWLVWRMDESYELEGDVFMPELDMMPSEYFRRQCIVSVEPDETPVVHLIAGFRQRPARVLDRLPARRFALSEGDRKFPRAADLGRGQAQDPLGQLRPLLRGDRTGGSARVIQTQNALDRFVRETRDLFARESRSREALDAAGPDPRRAARRPRGGRGSKNVAGLRACVDGRVENLLFYEDPDYKFAINGLVVERAAGYGAGAASTTTRTSTRSTACSTANRNRALRAPRRSLEARTMPRSADVRHRCAVPARSISCVRTRSTARTRSANARSR